MSFHVTIAAEGRLALFPSDAHRRAAARIVARVAGAEVPLFCVADDHGHFLVLAERTRAGRVAANLALALRRIAAASLGPAHFKPVEDRTHLHTLVRYILDQTTHHELRTADHPALWPGSSFADLVGARILPGFDATRLTEALPRLTTDEIYAAVGLGPVEPATDDVLAGMGIDALARAAAEVVGAESVAMRRQNGARALVARVAAYLGVGRTRTARALGTTVRQVNRLEHTRPDPELAHALRTWVAIVEAVRRGPPR